jgi:hypothetical protein
MKGWILASVVVVVTNAAALGPALRARSGAVREVTSTACPAQVVGGYGETDRLRLSVRPQTTGAIAGLDPQGMQHLGFEGDDVARLGDSTISTNRLPPARAAWIRMQQGTDSSRDWRVVAVGPTRASVDGDGLIVRGRVGFGYESIAPQGMRLSGQLFATEPTTLYLGAHEAAVLRPLRQRGAQCAQGTVIVLGNGSDGSLWVSAVR